ncbi:Gfo/Idh/MocA family oxidoreductase [Aquiflexum sp. LQ15W]|uniref:Gfo/Idh/MocA family protein n=1 Tax=Cognataquiflexum nitidum TaxID=2922272 RepID=UPI001F12E486|nr:Gfo/Idh/MocA family oxidoreductase [Cognataquiflexum nitidum]MCH6198672.1 Gfo/Idh/MocA family oxidoreductase [Cognataquiflexum nitidum]
MKPTRRKFIEKTLTTTVGIGLFSFIPSKVWAKTVRPSDQVNVALIGCNGHGFSILRHHLNMPGVNCVAICDVDENVLSKRIKEVKETFGQDPKPFKDFRKVLEQKDIDAVIIGTPDHWHCLIMVAACAAGKDVYVEKPLANSIGESSIMVEAAAYYKRVVQVGQQQRSGYSFSEPVRMIKNGDIGKIRKVNIWSNFNYGTGAIPAGDSLAPSGVDYDFWLGPAPKRPFNPTRFHGSWRHFWDYGGGLMTDWGVHLLDMGIWAMQNPKAPLRVITTAVNSSTDVRSRETFDTMSVIYANEEFTINWDMTAGIQQGPYGKSYGIAFIGENATIVADRKSFQVYPEWDSDKKEAKAEAFLFTEGSESHNLHVKNFIDCIKSRETPICPPETGRIAALYAHIPNISGRTNEPILDWDDKKQMFTNSKKANGLITPTNRTPWEFPKF